MKKVSKNTVLRNENWILLIYFKIFTYYAHIAHSSMLTYRGVEKF